MAVKKLPTLFKKSNAGKVLEWRIKVEGTTIVTTHGQVGGKMQTTSDLVKSGKNAGRKNATEAAEQALKEATAKWTKQKKAGYVESIGAAEAGETDALIEGGVLPMLAKVYEHVEDEDDDWEEEDWGEDEDDEDFDDPWAPDYPLDEDEDGDP